MSNDTAEKLREDNVEALIDNNISSISSETVNSLLESSQKYRFEILWRYRNLVSQEILERYETMLKLEELYREREGIRSPSPISYIYKQELGRQLERIVDKYLSLSSSDIVTYLGTGTMSTTFRLGDYVLKVGYGKWSYEDVICPRLYLILKNLEEYLIRDNRKVVVANLEVQPFLKKTAFALPDSEFDIFREELEKLGYWTNELLRGRNKYDDNFGLLDSYKDADCDNPELLPDHFKKTPLVLCDRDKVYKIGSRIKERQERWID